MEKPMEVPFQSGTRPHSGITTIWWSTAYPLCSLEVWLPMWSSAWSHSNQGRCAVPLGHKKQKQHQSTKETLFSRWTWRWQTFGPTLFTSTRCLDDKSRSPTILGHAKITILCRTACIGMERRESSFGMITSSTEARGKIMSTMAKVICLAAMQVQSIEANG